MKKGFILYILVFLSCAQDQDSIVSFDIERKKTEFSEEIEVSGYRLASSGFLFFTLDDPSQKSGRWLKRLNYWNPENANSPTEKGKIDLSDGFYRDTLLFFSNESISNQVIIWKYEGEYWSYLNVYLFNGEDDELIDIGDVSLGIDCVDCDSFNYPNDSIVVKGNNEEVEIRFPGESIYRGSLSQGTQYHSVDISTIELRLIFDGTNSKVKY